MKRLSGGCSSALLSGDSWAGLAWPFLRGVTSRPRRSPPPSPSRNSYSSITPRHHALVTTPSSRPGHASSHARALLPRRRSGPDWRGGAARGSLVHPGHYYITPSSPSHTDHSLTPQPHNTFHFPPLGLLTSSPPRLLAPRLLGTPPPPQRLFVRRVLQLAFLWSTKHKFPVVIVNN